MVFLLFVFCLSLTVLGPVFHYTAWGIGLIFIIYAKIRYGVRMLPEFTHCGKVLVLCLVLFFVFSAMVYYYYAPNLYQWGRWASIYAEILLGLFFAAYLINTPKRRDTFLRTFFYLNMIALTWLVLDQLGICKFPSKTFFNHNMLGPYLCLAIPLHVAYLVRAKLNTILKALLFSLNIIFIIFSFSSITWAACFIEMLIMLFLFYKVGKSNVRFALLSCVLLVCSLAALNIFFRDSFVTQGIFSEGNQISSINSFNRLTTNRNEIWSFTIKAIKQRPLIGYGKDSFGPVHRNYIDKYADSLHLVQRQYHSHAHNQFLMVAFEIGIPGLLFLLIAFIIPIIASLKNLYAYPRSYDPIWDIIFLATFVGELLYGQAGEMTLDLRSDVAVILWTFWGIFSVYRNNETYSEQGVIRLG